MGFQNELSQALGDLEAVDDAIAEAEREVRDRGLASCRRLIDNVWRFYGHVRERLGGLYGPYVPLDVQRRSYEIWQRLSDLDGVEV